MRVTEIPGRLPAALALLNAVYGSNGYRTPAAVLQASLWSTVGTHLAAGLLLRDAAVTLDRPA